MDSRNSEGPGASEETEAPGKQAGDGLARIAGALGGDVAGRGDNYVLAQGDSAALLQSIPSASVRLVLTDPPYHATQKANIYGDRAFKLDEEYLVWMELYLREFARILKPNGSLYVFCSPKLVGRLEARMLERFNVLANITWTKPNEPGFDGWKQKMRKDSLRTWYPHSERVLFAEPAGGENLHRSHLGQLLRSAREQAGMTSNRLAELTGAYGKVNHGGAVSNWETGRNIPSRDQYTKLSEALVVAGASQLPRYEDAVRPFQYQHNSDFTDVWTFENVRPYKGKHPAEKPLAMLQHIVKYSTYPDDLVLDCFAGSSSTGVAALSLGRRYVGIEIEERWVSEGSKKLALAADLMRSGSTSLTGVANLKGLDQPRLF